MITNQMTSDPGATMSFQADPKKPIGERFFLALVSPLYGGAFIYSYAYASFFWGGGVTAAVDKIKWKNVKVKRKRKMMNNVWTLDS